jgi:ribosomal protein L21E
METIKITPAEETIFNDFKEGNSVQVRVTVQKGEEGKYAKGKTVKVVFNNAESTARIVSDPLVVQPETDDGKELISLIVEKS